MKKRILIALGVLVLAAGIGAGGWYYYTHHAGSAGGSDIVYVTKISKLSEMDSGVENRYAGVVEPQETVQVKIESGRKVKEVQVKTGQEVKKGQLLFQYDLRSIQQSLQEAQLALDRLKNEQLSISDQITTLEAEKKKATADNQLSYTIEIETQKMNLKKNEYDQKSKQAERPPGLSACLVGREWQPPPANLGQPALRRASANSGERSVTANWPRLILVMRPCRSRVPNTRRLSSRL